MSDVLHVIEGQSEAAFFASLSGGTVYVETALIATRSFSGLTALGQEVTRRTAGAWSLNNQGNSFSSGIPIPVRWGGTSFIDDWQQASTSISPYTGNSDSRLAGRFGETFFNSIDTILASHAASSDAFLGTWFRQTWESADADWPFNSAEYAYTISNFFNFYLAKVAAAMPGKPARIMVVSPGQTDRGGLNHALMHEVHLHLAQNGVRSTRASLAGIPRISGFYIGTHAALEVSFGSAEQADTGTAGTDFAHQSAGSAQRTALSYALEIARWLEPAVAREFDGHPVPVSAFPKPGTPNTLRVRFAITPGNYLVWQGPAAEDTDIGPNGAFTATPTNAHLYLHQTAINSATAPSTFAATSVSVDNSERALGRAYLDIACPAAIVAGRYITFSAGQNPPGYTRRTEAIATTLKKKIGLWEATVASPDLNASCADLLAATPLAVLPVLPVANLLITAQDPIAMADLTPAGVTLVENWLRTQITHAGLRKTGTEVSASGYARAPITWSANGQPMENTNQLDFGTAITDTGINEVAGYTASTGGSAVVVKAITAVAPTAQTVRLAAGAIDGVAA